MSNFTFQKFLIIAGVVLVLFIGIAIGSGPKQNNSPPAGNFAPNVVKENVSGETVAEKSIFEDKISESEGKDNKIKTSESNPAQDLVKVIRVIDGDTIEIEGGERVRYIGIDTPETVDPRKPVQCFGVEAFNKNKELVEGKMARLEKDITDRDKYNRLLRYVWVGDVFVNLELVKQGFAYSYSYPPDVKYQDQFVKAQQEARESKRGLWNSCPAQDEAAIF